METYRSYHLSLSFSQLSIISSHVNSFDVLGSNPSPEESVDSPGFNTGAEVPLSLLIDPTPPSNDTPEHREQHISFFSYFSYYI